MSVTSLQLYFSGDLYFQRAIEAISQAREEVLLESYIFEIDPIGLRFMQALSAAQARGVQVKVMVDGIGSFNSLRELRLRCEKGVLPLRVYHPLPLGPEIRVSWRALRRMLRFYRRVNQRNHRKVILIDGKHAFIGSLNISQVHTREFMGRQAWRDTGVEMTFAGHDEDAKLLRDAFFKTWAKTKILRASSYPVRFSKRMRRMKIRKSRLRLNSRSWWRFILLRDLVFRIRNAKNRILITNAYFIPRRALLSAIKRAARRGVHVELVLPQKTDVWFVREASRSLFDRLLRAGVKIHEYQPSVLHAKTLVIDDWATVGSHNLNHRSLLHDLEVETVIEEPDLIEQLVSHFETDVRQSSEITLMDLGRHSFIRRGFARVVYWFRYWL